MVFIHEAFNRSTQRNDIALLLLSNDAELGYGIKPVCLPITTPPDGTQCYVTGWGNTNKKYDTSALREANVPIVSWPYCNNRYLGKVTQQMLCAGYAHGGVDACKGDSEGPLVCERNGQFFLHGITSWGLECGKSYSPGVYTDVSKYLNWIKEKSNIDEETYKNLKIKSYQHLIKFFHSVAKSVQMK